MIFPIFPPNTVFFLQLWNALTHVLGAKTTENFVLYLRYDWSFLMADLLDIPINQLAYVCLVMFIVSISTNS